LKASKNNFYSVILGDLIFSKLYFEKKSDRDAGNCPVFAESMKMRSFLTRMLALNELTLKPLTPVVSGLFCCCQNDVYSYPASSNLQVIFSQLKMRFTSLSRTMILRKLVPLFFFNFLLFSGLCANSSYEYQVTVLDEQGQPLPGVNVFTDDLKKVATITDHGGKALLVDLNYREEVNFTFIGYQPLKLPFFEIRKRNGIIQMKPEASELLEVLVLGRRDDTPDKVPYQTSTISDEDLSLTESQTTVDALQQHAGVFVQKSQMGGGSPVMRGHEANRVVLVVDGVKLNNAIYRGGHLQNAITIDNGMLERMEVTFGPGSLMYGSDALGGVVHFRSKEPKLNFDKTPGSYRMESNFFTRYATANEEKSIHADLNYGKSDWASLTSFTFTDFGDLRAGGNRPAGYEHFGRRLYFVRRVDGGDQIIENVIKNSDGSFSDNSNVQIGTAYSQIDFTQKIKYQPGEHFYNVLNFQYSTSSDVPRYDNLSESRSNDPSDLKWAEWFYGPQKRLLASLKTRLSKPTGWYDRATFIGAFQKLDEDRLSRRLHRSQRDFNIEDVWVYSLTADFDKKLDSTGQHQLMYGFDLSHNDVRSVAGKVKMSDESIDRSVLTRYPGGENRISNAGIYTNYRWQSKDSVLALNAGLRYTYAHLFSSFRQDSIIIWPDYYLDPGVKSNNDDLTWSAGLTLKTPSGFDGRLLVSKAFRSPNLDDFSNIRAQNGFVTIPNPDLGPETSINYEISLGQQIGRIVNGKGVAFRLGGTAWYTSLKDFIVRRTFPLPDGSNTLVMDGDTLETIAKVNAETGYIYGWSGNASLHIGSRFTLSSDLHFTKGRTTFREYDDTGAAVIDTLVPAAHIPPLYGSTTLTFSGKKFKISGAVRYQGEKLLDEYAVANVFFDDNGDLQVEKGGTEDNPELSYTRLDAEGNREMVGTLAWTTFNLYTSWQLSQRFTVNLAVENITDLHYRQFSSGLSAPGRNFILSVRARFGK
jgi:hemoglobin/transferrin/lactoferrin receptor protein